MKLSFGCDHGGLELKNKIIEHVKGLGHEVIDCGTYTNDSCDYPEFGLKAATMVANKEVDLGILVCTTGEGIMMSANKVKGVRCAMGYCPEVAKLCREHNNANMIAFGQKFMDHDMVIKAVDNFLTTPFEGGRHERRVNIIVDYENK